MISEAPRQANSNCAQTFASLRLFGDDLQPEEITRLLGIEPSNCAIKGDQATSSSGKTRTAATGRWILETEARVDSNVLEDHLDWLLGQVEPSKLVPLDLPGVSSADIFCYWVSATGHGGPDFSPEVLARLARLHLTLSLDIYFDSPHS